MRNQHKFLNMHLKVKSVNITHRHTPITLSNKPFTVLTLLKFIKENYKIINDSLNSSKKNNDSLNIQNFVIFKKFQTTKEVCLESLLLR